MTKIIEAKAIISAEDRLSSVVDGIGKRLKGLGKGIKVSADVERLNKSLAQTKQQLAAIDKIKDAQSRVSSAKLGLSGVKAEADRIAAAMAAAKRAGDAGVTAGLARESKAVQRNLAQATAAVERQSASLAAAKRGLNEFGVPITNLVAHERALKGAADQATAAIRKQTDALSQQDRRERVMERWQARGRDRARAADERRQAIEDRRRITSDAQGQDYRRHLDRHGVVHAAAAGAAGYVGVHSVAHEIKDTVRAGARYQHEVVALQNAGRTPEEMREIEHASHNTTRAVPTATYEENLKVINETTGAFGSLHHAIEHLTFMQKAASVVHAAAGDKVHEDAGEMGNKMARFGEERGSAGNSEQFQRETAKLVRAMVFTRGNFNPTEMLNFAQQAKASLIGYNEEFLTSYMPSIVSTMKGDRAGTAANAFNGVIDGKVNDKKQAEEWLKLGLLDPKQAIMKAGHAVGWRTGAIKNTDKAHANPLQWMEEDVLPALAKKGGKDGTGINVEDKEQLKQAFATLFRSQTANMFANEIGQLMMRQRLHKDKALMDQAGSMDDIYNRNLTSDPQVALTAMTAALENLATAASAPAMETAAGYIKAMAEQMQTLALAAKDHPALAMTGGVAAAGAGLAGAGWMSYQVLNGFGLGKSAVALDGSAVALTEAAAALGGKGLLGGAAGAAANGADKVGAVGRLGALGALGAAGLGVAAIAAGVYAVDQSLPNNNRMNGNGKGVRSGGAGAYMPGGWGNGYVDVSGGVGAKDAPFVTNRPKTWMDTIFGGQASFRGGRDPTRMNLPTFGGGRGPMELPAPPMAPTMPQGPVTVPLPPQRPPDLGGKLQVSLAPDSRLEATVKPDQITAKVAEIPPVTGEVSVTVQPQRVILEINSDLIKATAGAAAQAVVAKAQIGSSGGRPGAVSMPDAATTPGAAK